MLARRGITSLALRRTIAPTTYLSRAISTERDISARQRVSRLPINNNLITSRKASTSAEAFQELDDEAKTKQPPKWFRRPVVLILAFMPIFTFGLGVWQIQRLQWKLELIDELENKLKKQPLDLPRNIDLELLLANYTNRLFAVSGRFPNPDAENAVFLGPRVREGEMGYHIVQPLQRNVGGDQVLVDRGFVPVGKIVNYKGDRSTWRLMDSALDESSGEHLMLLPRPKERNSFTPANDPSKHTWHFGDPTQLANYFSHKNEDDDHEDSYTPSAGVSGSVKEMLGLQRPSRQVLPVYLEEIFEGNAADLAKSLEKGYPIGRAATVELRNQHAVYAATWFSLSAATTVMFGILIRRGR